MSLQILENTNKISRQLAWKQSQDIVLPRMPSQAYLFLYLCYLFVNSTPSQKPETVTLGSSFYSTPSHQIWLIPSPKFLQDLYTCLHSHIHLIHININRLYCWSPELNPVFILATDLNQTASVTFLKPSEQNTSKPLNGSHDP